MSDRAKEAVTSIIQAMKTSQMYPQDHPRVQDKIGEAVNHLETIFEENNKFILGVDGGQLLIQDAPADQSNEFLEEFKHLVEERNIGSLVLERGLSRNELLDLIWILRNDPSDILEENEIRDDLISSFDHVDFNSVSVQISENGMDHASEDQDESETEDHKETDGGGASPYEVLVEQLDDILEEVDTDDVLSDLPEDMKEKLKSSFTKLGFNVLSNVLNQLVEQMADAGEELSGQSTKKILNQLLENMTEEKEVRFSEFKKGLDESLSGMEAQVREALIDSEDASDSDTGSSDLLSGLNSEVRGNIIGNELREGSSEHIKEAISELSGSGDDLLAMSEQVAGCMDVSTDAEVSDLSTYFDTLFEDVSFPEKQGRVAFVDDDQAFREQYAAVLKQMGFEVDEFDRGKEAWDTLSEEKNINRYDLLVMDMDLPRKSGLDLLKDLGALRMELPVIVATKEAEFRSSFEVLTYPNLEFHEKPVAPEEFFKSVSDQVRMRSQITPDQSEAEAEERQEAREIQNKLIDREFPQLESFRIETYYEPSKYVGGDILQYMPLSKSRSLFLIGDVSGSGVPAAMIMVMVRSILRMCFGQMNDPEKAVKRANQLISRDMREGMYVSLALCIVDTDEETLTVINAGQRTPIVWRDEDEQSELLLSDGIALGLADQKTFESSLNSKTLEMKPRDTIVFYTEGISEALNEEGETFAVRRLLSIASEFGGEHPETLTREIVKGVKQFQQDAPQEKDSTLMTIQFNPS